MGNIYKLIHLETTYLLELKPVIDSLFKRENNLNKWLKIDSTVENYGSGCASSIFT